MPYLNFKAFSSTFVDDGFEFCDGFFIPIFTGNMIFAAASFSHSFKKGYECKDIKAL